MNPYVFLVGCPRSGTTLLGRIGDAHSELAVVHESRWIPRCFEYREGLTPGGDVEASLVDRLRDARALRPFGVGDEELRDLVDAYQGASFASFVTAVFDRYGRQQGKPLVGDKSPGYVRYLPTLHELWPQAKFVHIIRDGRDVCLSVLDWRKGATVFSTFDDDPVTTIGVWWEWYVELGREGGERIGRDLYHELRYENLVAEPERETAHLCEFLHIPFDPSMVRFHEGRMRLKPGRSAKSAWLPITRDLRNWRAQMAADDVRRFEAAAGHVLEELGYPRAAPSIARRELEHASRVRETLAREVDARSRPVPQAWAGVAA
jgi:hypothetical protein